MRHGPTYFSFMLALGILAGEGSALAAQPDPAALFRQHRLAAAQGNPAGLDGLGTMFERGGAAPVDLAKAYAFFHLAASRQSSDPALVARAIARRDALGARMSPAQLSRVNELIALCNGSDVNHCGEIIIAAGAPAVATVSTQSAGGGRTSVPLEPLNGIYVVPAVINGVMSVKFAVDTGAADVAIPADIVASLVQGGFIEQADFIGEQTYRIADGSTRLSRTFRIRSLQVGNLVVEDVRGSVLPEKAAPLLGQSFLRRLKSWSMDTTAHVLTME